MLCENNKNNDIIDLGDIESFVHNHDNINKDWTFLFKNNLSKENYRKSLLALKDRNDKNKSGITEFLHIIYQTNELNNLCYFLYNKNYDIYLNNIDLLLKDVNMMDAENKYNCDLYNIIISRANKQNHDAETLKYIYKIIQLNIDNTKVSEYTDFLKESNMFNNILFKKDDVDKKANELIAKIIK